MLGKLGFTGKPWINVVIEKKRMSNIQEEIAGGSAVDRDKDGSDAGEPAATEGSGSQNKPKTSLEQYCDDNPSASECRIYEE